MLDLKPLRILVTGGNGFLGKAVCRELVRIGAEVSAPPSSEYDLRDRQQCHKMHFDHSPHIVIHLAAKCGGIGANMAAPADFIHDNLVMGANVISCAEKFGVLKFVLVGTACSYPQAIDRPIVESDLWSGYPEPTNAPYGIAKRCLGEMLGAYHRQYGLPAAYVIPANLYGPGDCFDANRSHVIPAMIRRFCEAVWAGAPSVTCWGTGAATRDFLYVDDAARGIVEATRRLRDAEPVNIGTGTSITMTALADVIATACGYTGKTEWDATKPDGQPVRIVGTERQWGPWEPQVSLMEGVRKTVEWWTENGGTPRDQMLTPTGRRDYLP